MSSHCFHTYCIIFSHQSVLWAVALCDANTPNQKPSIKTSNVFFLFLKSLYHYLHLIIFVSLQVIVDIEFIDTTGCFCFSFPLILLRAVEQKMAACCIGLCFCTRVWVYVLVDIWSGCEDKDMGM